jgi:protein-arginine kinase activator protein McsA
VLCEKCNKVEAAVHITEVVAGAPEEIKKHDFCESCFSKTDFAKLGGETAPATSCGFTATILPRR